MTWIGWIAIIIGVPVVFFVGAIVAIKVNVDYIFKIFTQRRRRT